MFKASFLLIPIFLIVGCSNPENTNPEPTSIYYQSCSEAPGPIYSGDPGYRLELDRNKDGVACE